LLAALQSIPKDVYEAAEIDGAGPFQRFVSITVPYLAPTIVITVLLRAVWIANAADLIVVMTRGGPADSTQIVASYIFTQAFQRLDFGYASAIATVLLLFGSVGSATFFAGHVLVIALVVGCCWVTMLAAPRVMKVLGVTGANVLARLLGVVLAALAVQFVLDGVRSALQLG
jgi:ABC-type glycerol-3-phosphate transport system permease component